LLASDSWKLRRFIIANPNPTMQFGLSRQLKIFGCEYQSRGWKIKLRTPWSSWCTNCIAL
jgi:hypothetical protein